MEIGEDTLPLAAGSGKRVAAQDELPGMAGDSGKGGIAEEAIDGGDNRLRIGIGEEIAGVAFDEEIFEAADRGGEDGHAARHGFEDSI